MNAEQYILIIRLLLENTSWPFFTDWHFRRKKTLVNELAAGFPEERVKKAAGRFSLAELFSVIRNSSLLSPAAPDLCTWQMRVELRYWGFSVLQNLTLRTAGVLTISSNG
ncbi:MAG: hypothetical protein CM1200mP28_02710 [Deltaproteobacteria bacterium]|nr:MAG: hypothetical protein CM1200mP28_02710 [Deltaproteobacteria bacterium]